ncbi:hypothetical protein GOV09_06560 [Candidatus Woesearchaeota archaeon]|nr:hypothetical protein [Candidatus Woesearchaeota archaeon]
MAAKFESFKADIDGWIKQFNGDLTQLRDVPHVVHEHTDNIDHNYELIQETRAEVKRLKEEISALRMVQLLQLKAELQEKKI